jgi:hypothetical protein
MNLRIIVPAIGFILMVGCSKNDDNITLRNVLFGANADTVEYLLTNYNFKIPISKTAVFNDDFNSNSNGWPVYAVNTNSSNRDGFAKFQNGEYYVSGGAASSVRGFFINRQIDTSKNFEITCRLKNEGSYADKQLFFNQGLIIRGNNSSGYVTGTGLFLAGISVNNVVSLRKISLSDDTGQTFEVKTPNDFYYKLTLRKIKNRMSVFVNEQYISSYHSRDIYAPGNLLGFAVIDRLYVDYLTVEYLAF